MTTAPTYSQDSFSDYLSNPAISASDIKAFLKSPAYYHWKKNAPKEEKEAAHFKLGTAIHASVLTPELFEKQYFTIPKMDMRKTENKTKLAELEKQHEGKILLDQEEFEMIERIGESARKNKTLVELIKNAYFEMSIYTADEPTGLAIKLRPDIFCLGRSVICDLKSCLESSPKKFRYEVFGYSYDVTAAWYLHFSKKQHYVFAALEKQEPFQCGLYSLSESILGKAMEKVRMGLDLLAYCIKHEIWPDYAGLELMKQLYSIDCLDQLQEQQKINNEILTIE